MPGTPGNLSRESDEKLIVILPKKFLQNTEEGELLGMHEQNDSVIPLSTPVLFTEFDGFWVHLQTETKHYPKRDRHTYKEQFKKKSAEIKVWVAYAGKEGNKRICPIHWASMDPPDTFFSECVDISSQNYDFDDVEFCITNSDAAGWCKSNALEELLDTRIAIISKLDTYHVNQKVYRAFSSEEDRAHYLHLIYSRDFNSCIDES